MKSELQNFKGGCLIKIEALLDSLKSAESRLADYILKHPEEVTRLTIQELQDKSGSSYATIFRFCKKAGYLGYKDFKKSLMLDLQKKEEDVYITAGFPINMEDSVEEIVNKTFSHSHAVLEDTRKILNSNLLEEAAQIMARSNRIHFIGTGTSGVIAKYAYTRFVRMGISCLAETDPTMYQVIIAVMEPKEVLFAISASGRSMGIVRATKQAREKGIPVISLSDYAISPLTKLSNINLYTTPRNTILFSDLDVPLITGQINILDILFARCCSIIGRGAIEQYQKSKSGADLEKVEK